MDEGRPISLLAAVVLVGLIGIGGLLAAPVVVAEATVVEQLDDHLGAIGGAILMAGAIAAVVVGGLGVLGAVGLWRRRTWGWLAAVTTTALVVAGTVLAIVSGARETALALGLALGLAGALATLLPATRAACDR